ncbi:MAG: flagellar motor protein MotB [Planctomycetota bacterium]
MAKRKCKCPPAGAPEWMVTYGDMVTLLLCFFVLIVSFSEIKKEDEFEAVVEEIQKAFGMRGGGGKIPTPDDPALSLIQTQETVNFQQMKTEGKSNAPDPGQDGPESRVTRIRPGLLFAVGGQVLFEPASAELTERARFQLSGLADSAELRGTQNVIEVHGHAGRTELSMRPSDTTYPDLDSLSYARAHNVKMFLIGDQVGLDPERIRLVANADREPIDPRAYGGEGLRRNRRADLWVEEALVQDYQDPNAAMPFQSADALGR